VAVFSRSSTTGALTFVEVQRDGVGDVDGLDAASSVTVSPDGSHLYAAGRADDALAVFSRDSGTGRTVTSVSLPLDGVTST
jgi:6-phosphogluconolactonase (cycloisomerase 2 family)